jgi:hypothetical protein
MIDFSTLKGLTIPEGNVTKITDVSGNVLWEAPPSGVKITLSFKANGSPSFRDIAYIIIEGVKYPITNTNPATEELILPIGTIITCYVGSANTSVTQQKITLNGKTVANGTSEYLYTVVGEASIVATTQMTYTPMTGTVAYGTIAITEL